MGFFKALACLGGGIAAVVLAPIALPAAAALASAAAATTVGAAVVGAGTAAAGAVAAAGSAVAATTVGSAVIGAGTAAAGAVAAAGSAVAATTVGSAVIGAGTAVAGAAATVGVTASVTTAAAIGSGATYSALTLKEAKDNNLTAASIISDAKSKYDKAIKSLDKQLKISVNNIEQINKLKLELYSSDIKEAINYFSKFFNIEEESKNYVDKKLNKAFFTKAEIKQIALNINSAEEIVKNISSGASFASATAGLAVQLTSSFGFASTGTAISSLSGAAAQKATLASLGGGSLSSGGAGMLGGRLMLGGVGIAASSVIYSMNKANQAQKNLTSAVSYNNEVGKKIEDINTQISFLKNDLDVRVSEIKDVLNKYAMIYRDKVSNKIKDVYNKKVNKKGLVNFSSCSKSDKSAILLSILFIKSYSQVMRLKILDKNGNLNRSTTNAINSINKNKQYDFKA